MNIECCRVANGFFVNIAELSYMIKRMKLAGHAEFKVQSEAEVKEEAEAEA